MSSHCPSLIPLSKHPQIISPTKHIKEREWSEKPWKETLSLLDQPGFPVDSSLYAALLRHCGNSRSLLDGKRIHAHMSDSGHLRNRYLKNLLLQMYAKCGAVQDAADLFSKFSRPDVFSWTFMIAAHANAHAHYHDNGKTALQLFQQMLQQGELPNEHTLVYIFSVCANHMLLSFGKLVHALVVGTTVYMAAVMVVSSMVNMYGKSGCLHEALELFDSMHERSTVSWNVLLSAFLQYGHSSKAFWLSQQMKEESCIPSRISFLEILDACATMPALLDGKRVHSIILSTGLLLTEVTLGNSLINMYAKCGKFQDALIAFDMMPERNVTTWNTVIAACNHYNRFKHCVQCFQQMQLESVMLNELTFIVILSGCTSSSCLATGREMHTRLTGSGFECNTAIRTTLMSMYSSCNDLKSAQAVFNFVPEYNVILWNALITAYVHHGENKRAYEIFFEMQQKDIKPDRITILNILNAFTGDASLSSGQHLHCNVVDSGWDTDVAISTALIDMYGKCCKIDDALNIFESMSEWNIISWTAMITTYGQHGYGYEALQHFDQMKVTGLIPDCVSYIGILDAFSSHSALCKGKQIHTHILNQEFDSYVALANTLINTYAKCGSLEDSLKVFSLMEEPNAISWTTLISAYAQQGRGKEAMEMFLQMQCHGVAPDEATLRSMLTACSHGGLAVEGSQCWASFMSSLKDIASVSHYNNLIDLFVRTGKLAEGEQVIDQMPFHPTSMSWLTLLAACRTHADMERGEWAARNVFAFGSENAAPYILLANIHAASEDSDQMNDDAALMAT